MINNFEQVINEHEALDKSSNKRKHIYFYDIFADLWKLLNPDVYIHILSFVDIFSISNISHLWLSPTFINQYANTIRYKITKNEVKWLSRNIIYKYWVRWPKICANQKLSEKIMIKYNARLCWHLVSKYQKLSGSFIMKFHDKLDWNIISKYQIIPEYVLIQHSDKINWKKLKHESVTDNIGNLYKNKLNWSNLSRYRHITEKFIITHRKQIKWKYLSRREELSAELIIQCKDDIDWNLAWLYKNDLPLTIQVIDACSEYIIWHMLLQRLNPSVKKINMNKYAIKWNTIASTNPISEYMLRQYHYNLNWNDISKHQGMGIEFMKEFADKLNWKIITNRLIMMEGNINKFYKEEKLYENINNLPLSKSIRRRNKQIKNRIKKSQILYNCEDIDWDTIYILRHYVDWELITPAYCIIRYHPSYYTIKMSLDNLNRFQDYVNWHMIFLSYVVEYNWGKYKYDIIYKFKNKINWNNFTKNNKDFLIKHINNGSHITDILQDSIDWDLISSQHYLNEDIIKKHYLRIDWSIYTSSHRESSYEFIMSRLDNIYVEDNLLLWDYISQSIALIEKNIDVNKNRLNWCIIAKRVDLTDEFVCKYKQYIDQVITDD